LVKKKTAQPKQLLPENKAPRANIAEQQKRIIEVIEMISKGTMGTRLLQTVASRYGVSERTAYDLIAYAKERLVEDSKETVDQARQTILANYWDIIEDTKKAKEYSTTVSALKEVSKLKGLDQQIINHNVTISKELEEIPDAFIDAELVDKDE